MDEQPAEGLEIRDKPALPEKRKATGRPFVKGDPRIYPRQPGQVMDTTRLAQAMLREKAAELVARGLKLCDEYRQDEPPACPMCGRGMRRPEEFQLKAIQTMLDRAGIGPTQKVEVKTINFDFVKLMTDDELDLIGGIIEQAKTRVEAEQEQEVGAT